MKADMGKNLKQILIFTGCIFILLLILYLLGKFVLKIDIFGMKMKEGFATSTEGLVEGPSYTVKYHRSDGYYRTLNIFYPNRSVFNKKDTFTYVKFDATGDRLFKHGIKNHHDSTWHQYRLVDKDGIHPTDEDFGGKNTSTKMYTYSEVSAASRSVGDGSVQNVDGFPEEWLTIHTKTTGDNVQELRTGNQVNGWRFDASDYSSGMIEDDSFTPETRGRLTRYTYDYDSGFRNVIVGNSWVTIDKNKVKKVFPLEINYRLEATIHPTGKRPGWSNILLSTATNVDRARKNDRIPGIWFYSNTTRLHIRTTTNELPNFGLDPPGQLPLNQDTKLVITVLNNKFTVELSGGYNYKRTVNISPNRDPHGTTNFYIAKPWSNPSFAKIKRVVVTNLKGNNYNNVEIYTNRLPSWDKFQTDGLYNKIGPVINTEYVTHFWDGYIYYEEPTTKHFGITGDDDCFIWIIKGDRKWSSLNYIDGETFDWIEKNIPDATLVAGDPNRHGRRDKYYSGRRASVNMDSVIVMNAFGSYTFEKDTLYTILMKVTEATGGQNMYFGISDFTLKNQTSRQSTIPDEFFASYTGSMPKGGKKPISAKVNVGDQEYTYFPYIPSNNGIDNYGSETYNLIGGNWEYVEKGRKLKQFELKKDYRLEMTLHPTGVRRGWSNIIHSTITGRNCCGAGDRVPAIWFYSNTTRLHIRTSTLSSGNDGYDPPGQLPLNMDTKLVLMMLDDTMTIELSGGYNFKVSVNKNKFRHEGLTTFWCGDPWHNQPNGLKIKNMTFTNLKAVRSFGDYEYKFCTINQSWMEHYNDAKAWGGDLVSVHSEAEDNFIKQMILDTGRNTRGWKGPFTGGERIPGQVGRGGGADKWRWTDGTRWNYEKYVNKGEPNNWRWNNNDEVPEDKIPATSTGSGEDAIHFSGWTGNGWNDIPKRIRRTAIYKRLKEYASSNSEYLYEGKKYIILRKNLELLQDVKYKISTSISIGDDDVNDKLHYILIRGGKKIFIYPNQDNRDANGYYKIEQEFRANSRNPTIELVSEISNADDKEKPIRWKPISITYKTCDQTKCEYKPCKKEGYLPEGYTGELRFGSLDLPEETIASNTYLYKYINQTCKDDAVDCDNERTCSPCPPGKLIFDDKTSKEIGYLWPGGQTFTPYLQCEKEAMEIAELERVRKEELEKLKAENDKRIAEAKEETTKWKSEHEELTKTSSLEKDKLMAENRAEMAALKAESEQNILDAQGAAEANKQKILEEKEKALAEAQASHELAMANAAGASKAAREDLIFKHQARIDELNAETDARINNLSQLTPWKPQDEYGQEYSEYLLAVPQPYEQGLGL